MSRGSMMPADDWVAPANRLATLPPWLWDPMDSSAPMTLGYAAAQWAETRLRQPNGPRAGEMFRCTAGQLRWLLWWYAMDNYGDWLFNHGVRRLAKGSGKSPFAGVQCHIEFCGPVRLARKDSREPGGCVGKPVEMPLVQIAAVAGSQTQNTMRYVRAFAPKGSAVVKEYDLDPGKTRYYKMPEGTLEIITSSVLAAEGGEASFIVCDQTENSKPSNNGPEFVAVLADNLAKSGSRMLETPNAWTPGQESVAEASWDAWVAQEEGKLRGETKILYDARVFPPDTNMADPDSLRSGLEFVYDDCDWKRDRNGVLNVRSQMERIWSPLSKQSESMRKYGNRPSVPEEAWWAPRQWEVLADLERKVSPTELVVLFFDGSKSRDATAFVGCCISDGFVFVPNWVSAAGCTIWEPDTAHNTNDVVPVPDVDLALTHIFATHNVVAMFGDVQEWESFVKIEWPKRFGERLLIMSEPTGKDHQQIAWDMRSHVFDYTKAVELADAEIINKGFRHDGNPILARHIANCRRRPNRWGVSVGKESPSSPLKIDAAVCAIGARMVRRLAIASGKLPKPKTGRGRRAIVL